MRSSSEPPSPPPAWQIAVLSLTTLTTLTLGVAFLLLESRRASLDELHDEITDGGTAMDDAQTPLAPQLGLACAQAPQDADLPSVPDGPVDAQIDAIGRAVESLRGLQFDGEPPVGFKPVDEFAAEVTREAEEAYTPEQARIDGDRLFRLGAIEPGTDVRAQAIELLSQQAVGFYDPDSGEVVVRGDVADSLGPQEQITVAHELEHALIDQHVGLPEIGPDAGDDDELLTRLSVMEGGAVLVQNRFASGTLSSDQRMELGSGPQVQASREALEAVPHQLRRQLVFPYEEGFAFVCHVYNEGGWEAVNELLADPPESSAAVLFPGRLDEGAPEALDLGSPLEGWEPVEETTFGLAELMWLLEAPGDDREATVEPAGQRASAWDGGVIRTLRQGERVAVELAMAQRESHPSLCETMTDWHEAAFPDVPEAEAAEREALAVAGEGHAGVIVCADQEVHVGLAPELDTARQLAQ